MRFIHPKKYWRKAKNAWNVWRFKCEAKRLGITLTIGEGVTIKDCHLQAEYGTQNNELIIGDCCYIWGAKFAFHGSNNAIRMQKRMKVNARLEYMTHFHVTESQCIEIGQDCLFSNSIMVSTSDFHSVSRVNEEERINPDRSIKIGNHVWVGERAYIKNGVTIADDSIVGACSVVTRSFRETNVLIAGNPASTKKEGITWEN